MSLTPLEIQKKEFKKSMRGCDQEEVEYFLEEISEYVEQLLKEKEELAAKLAEMESEHSALKVENDKVLNAPVDQSAEKEAKLIIREAELKALEVLENNRSETNRLKDELVVLKQQKNSFIKRLKHLFASQLELIDVLEIEDVELDEIRDLQKQKERKKFTSKQIAEVPAFKRNQVEPNADIDLSKLSSGNKTEENITELKEKAKEILNESKQKPAEKINPDDLNLDDILGRIGENGE